MNDKVASLVGFAVKADKLIYGLDDLTKGKRKRYLILCCSSLSERSKGDVLKVAKRDGIPVIVAVGVTIEQLTHKKNCKVIGISDKQMSDAILKYMTNDYSLIMSEGN